MVCRQHAPAAACLKFALILQLFTIYLFTNYRLDNELNCLPIQIVFTGIANTISTPIRWKWGQSRLVAGKDYISTKNSQMASIGANFSTTYHYISGQTHQPIVCSELQQAVCLLRGDKADWSGLSQHLRTSDKLQEQATAKVAWTTFSIKTWLNCNCVQ